MAGVTRMRMFHFKLVKYGQYLHFGSSSVGWLAKHDIRIELLLTLVPEFSEKDISFVISNTWRPGGAAGGNAAAQRKRHWFGSDCG